MVKLRLTNASSTEKKDTPMPATRARAQYEPPYQMLLRFRPHDGSRRIQERSLVSLAKARPKSQLHWRDLKAVHAAGHIEPLSDFIIAVFSEVEQKMAPALAVALKEDVVRNWSYTSTKGFTNRAKLANMFSYAQLTGTGGIKKKLCYPNWFFLAVWLGPGHPFLESIRKDISDHWGVQLPTDEIIYPIISNRETEERLFNGEVTPTPSEASIEERAKAIKKTIEDSTVKGLSATIKGHLPEGLSLNGFGDSTRIQTLETSLASTNRELEGARKQVSNLENQLAESKESQARAQEKTNSDMETLRKEVQLLKTVQAGNIKKDVEALRMSLLRYSTSCGRRKAEIETKVHIADMKAKNELNVLCSEVAQSAEKAEKAVETGALLLSVLSTPGGQKRKMDEIS